MLLILIKYLLLDLDKYQMLFELIIYTMISIIKLELYMWQFALLFINLVMWVMIFYFILYYSNRKSVKQF